MLQDPLRFQENRQERVRITAIFEAGFLDCIDLLRSFLSPEHFCALIGLLPLRSQLVG